MVKYEYVFWDWNGTLFNDARPSFLAVNEMLRARNLCPITFDQYREYVDVPITRFYERVMDMSKENFSDISVEFHRLCGGFLGDDPLAEGACELLESLYLQGIKQYIFTSSREEMILPHLKRHGIDKYFTAILGATDFYAGSKAERTREYMVNNNINAKKAVFVGDLVHDSEVASFVGSDCVLVSSGHQSKEKLLTTGREVVSTLLDIKF